MRVLVTGASGFIGRMTCAELRGHEHQVMALVRTPGTEPAGTRAIEGDVTDAASLARAIDSAQPDAIVHLAAARPAAIRDADLIEQVNVRARATWSTSPATRASSASSSARRSSPVTRTGRR